MSEIFAYHNYAIVQTRKSEIDPDVAHDVTVGTRCPRCKSQIAPMIHGDSQQCPHCRLHMQLYGNGLECSNAPLDDQRTFNDLDKIARFLRGKA